MGFHISKITKGILGESSKIREELDEYDDAMKQNIKILAMWELSDIYGALELLATKHNLSMDDLKIMSDKNQEMFISGERK